MSKSKRFAPASLVETVKALDPVNSYDQSDIGSAKLFADVFRDEVRYNTTAKDWYVYDGTVWKPDRGGMHVAHLAKDLADALLVYGTTIQDEDHKAAYIKYVARYSQAHNRDTLMKDARSECYIQTNDFDRDGNLFNCQNGVYHLDTGDFTPHRAEDLLSKVSNVIYDPHARSPLFERFVREIMTYKTEKILYLQKTIGVSLTTDTSLETCWMWYGPSTRNGKGTLAETIAYMMGGSSGYALTMAPETLAQRKNKDTRQASGDIARLCGCRFLNASEPPKRMLFDAALLKTLLGRDTIVARHLNEREFEFIPEFKLFINTNFLPLIQDDTLFSSGRINVLTFDRHFSPDEQDPTLKDRLRTPENVSGIFNWALEGLRWAREVGIEPPEEVKAATKAYRETSDKIGTFISECMEPAETNVGAGAAYQVFVRWCMANGYGTDSKRSFFDEMKSKGLFADKGTVNGVTVKNVLLRHRLSPEVETELPD